MSSAEDRFPTVPDSALDRLVDGDLDDLGRRELLLRLENDPDGWRRCALAFLEDQAFRQALALPPVAKPAPKPAAPAPRRRSILRLPMAASALAATFAAGLAVGGGFRKAEPVQVARPEARPPAPAVKPESVREVGYIDLVDDSAGEAPARRVPILSGPGLDERWLREQPSSIPDYVRAQWERQGYQVEERRKLVPVTLEDGRQVSIPVGEVALEYVGQQPF